MCLGMNPDKLTPGQRCASTSNRNFEGRQGPGGRTHLLSPGHGRRRGGHRPPDRRAGARLMQAVHHADRRRGAAAAGQRRHRQDHPGAVPQDDQAHRARRAPVRHAALRRATGAERPDFVLNQRAVPARRDPDRAREFRLRLVARACALGAAGFRHTLRDRAELRRHLPQQLLQERHPADPAAARGLRPADGGRADGRQCAAHRRSARGRWWCGRTARRSPSRSTRSASTCC